MKSGGAWVAAASTCILLDGYVYKITTIRDALSSARNHGLCLDDDLPT